MKKKLTCANNRTLYGERQEEELSFTRCFHGTIKREKTEDDKPVVRGKIKVNDGFIWAEAADQWILGEMLDEMVLYDSGL